MSLYLAEVIPTQVIQYLQTNIVAALSAELSAWPDGFTSLQPPVFYYDYEEDSSECPSLYVLEDSIDYRLDSSRANHINAIGIFRCGMVVEEYHPKELAHSTRRYANVLHKLLNNTHLDYQPSSTVVVRNIIKVRRTAFGDSFKKNAAAGDESGSWRKEFVHELEIEHYENFS